MGRLDELDLSASLTRREDREKRGSYEEAVEDMLARTDHPYAPWSLIEGDSKRYARVKVIETVIERIEQGMRRWGMEPPPPLHQAGND